MRKRYHIGTFIMLLTAASPALAEGNTFTGQVSAADWVERLPVLAVIVILTLVIDTVFIVPVLRRLRRQRPAALKGA